MSGTASAVLPFLAFQVWIMIEVFIARIIKMLSLHGEKDIKLLPALSTFPFVKVRIV